MSARRARAYDAELGRFTTRDPIGFSSGDTNAYRFVQNDPVNFADPSGLLLGLGILETLFLETTGTFGSTLELALFAQELNLGLAGAEVTTAFVGANAAASAPL